QIPTAGPRLCVRAWIVNCYFIFQSIHVGTCEPLNQMKLFGMRKPTIGEPKLLVEAFRVDHERIAFPFTHRTSVVERIVCIAANLPLLRPPVSIDNPVISISTTDEHENPFAIPVFTELNAIRQLELSGTTGRHAVQKHRVVFEEVALSQFV